MSAGKKTHILGISAYYHDSAAALVRDGDILAAAQEERFTRVKHDKAFPTRAVEYCLGRAGIDASQLDGVIFYEKPLLHLDRLLETYVAFAPAGFGSFFKAMPAWMHEKLHLPREIDRALGEAYTGKIHFCGHHMSHAASTFYASPFESAAVLTLDGVGEWSTATLGVGKGAELNLVRELRFPHSLGLLYSAFTYYLGFRVNSGEYKVMGLAPYGEPKYHKEIIEKLLDLREDGSFRMRMEYFNYCAGLTMTSQAFHDLFRGPPRSPEAELTQKHMDLAASIQSATNEIMLRMARYARRETGEKNLCMAGGVALNCVANGLILREKIFDRVFIQPAAGDAGGALGAALFAYHGVLGKPRALRQPDAMSGSLLGPSYGTDETRAMLDAGGAKYTELDEQKLLGALVQALIDGKVLGLLEGRMEFGPRALGARSIIGDARNPEMQSRMNLKIKFRESFRPFAPIVLEEDAADYFELDAASPYMLFVAPVLEKRRKPSPGNAKGIELLKQVRSEIPAVTHVDYSARVQTVSKEANPFLHKLLTAFKAKTGCSVLVNTSFNVRGEPIVCTPADAYRCFMNTEMDALAVGGFYLAKEDQDPASKDRADYLKQFALD